MGSSAAYGIKNGDYNGSRATELALLITSSLKPLMGAGGWGDALMAHEALYGPPR